MASIVECNSFTISNYYSITAVIVLPISVVDAVGCEVLELLGSMVVGGAVVKLEVVPGVVEAEVVVLSVAVPTK